MNFIKFIGMLSGDRSFSVTRNIFEPDCPAFSLMLEGKSFLETHIRCCAPTSSIFPNQPRKVLMSTLELRSCTSTIVSVSLGGVPFLITMSH
ncbi:hypothetical protein D3C71_1708610 [compost metagenome]